MIKACIFDLDGTLADTVESIAKGVNLALVQLGYEPRAVEEFNYYAGDGIDMSLTRALRADGETDGAVIEKGIVLTRKYFGEDRMYHVKPYPEMPELLQELKKRGIRIAVFSNKPHEAAIDVVHTLFGPDTFEWIQGQNEEVPKKPDPTGVFAIAKHFELEPCEIMYLGDTDTDMKTGVAAGMYTVGVTWGFRTREELEENHAAALADHPLQVLELIEALKK